LTDAAAITTGSASPYSWGTVRFLGTFLARPTEVPEIVANRVAEELAVDNPGRLADYARREPTHREHAGEIQRYRAFRTNSP
jgi:hypothetical protein